MDNRSPKFLCLKWTLIVITSLSLIGSIIIMATISSLAKVIVDSTAEQTSKLTDADKEALVSFLVAVVIAVCVITDIFIFIGLYGAIKEHYCSTMTFAIFMTLSSIGQFYQAIKAPALWSETVITVVVTVFAYAFARELRRLRYAQPTGMIFQAAQPQTTVIMTPGYTSGQYATPGQYANTGYPPQSYPSPPPPGFSAGGLDDDQPPKYSEKDGNFARQY